jgi:hypothetical protein
LKNKEFQERKKEWAKEMEERGLKKGEEYMLQPLEYAGIQAAKNEKKQKNRDAYGWDRHSEDALFNAYENRLSKLPQNNAGKAGINSDDPTQYGGTGGEISQSKIDRMAGELIADRKRKDDLNAKKREAYSERRDVDAINDANEKVNKKLKRAFDKVRKSFWCLQFLFGSC